LPLTGDKYYRYDPCKNESFVVPMTDFNNIPNNVTAVYFDNNQNNIWFFKGELYYTYSMKANTVSYIYNLFTEVKKYST
jgi:hypothetical protein